jgi:type IV secretory pathway TraG/TraD family ATPase VirD4
VSRMEKHPDRIYRPVLFLCDEYQMFATAGASDPSGDEKFFALSRQAKCVPVVATQSISSLKSVLPEGTWETLLQVFSNKIFLSLEDPFSAEFASRACGQVPTMVESRSTSESGQDARYGFLSNKMVAHKASVSVSRTWSDQMRPMFTPKKFRDLSVFQAIALIFDGQRTLPGSVVYLKPGWLDPNESYFDQVRRGAI